MNSPLLFILLVAILFVLIIVNNLYEKKYTNVFIAISVILAIVFYSYGYFYISEKNIPAIGISIIQSVFATLNMVSGKSSLSDVQSVPLYNNKIVLLIFYIIHLFIYTLVITTLLISFGRRLIVAVNNFIRLTFCKKNIYIFYKFTDRVKKIIDKIPNKDSQVIILDDKILSNKDDSFFKYVIRKHCVVINENIFETIKNENSSINKIISNKNIKEVLLNEKFKNNSIRVYAIDTDIEDNYRFVNDLYESIRNNTTKNRIILTVFMDDKYDLKYLQDNTFDFVRVYNEKEIMARVLVKHYPPSKYIEFENYKAKPKESFNCLMIGFGNMAQKIIRKLFIYGHFIDTDFNVDIIDKNYDNICGSFNYEFKFLNDERIYLNKHTKIIHKNIDVRSDEFYKYFEENKNKFEFVIVSAGSEKANEDIVKNILKLKNDNNLNFDIFDCLENRIFVYENNNNIRKEYNSLDYIIDDRIDVAGKWINYIYKKNIIDFNPIDKQVEIDEIWKKTDLYDRNNSISTADFFTSILKLSGYKKNIYDAIEYDEEELDNIKKKFHSNLKENYFLLTAIDHDRWAGYILLEEGYSYMDDATWDERAKGYNDNNKIRIQNDKEHKLHAYLRSMEDLNKLYVKERQVTGSDPNMRWNNINNLDMALLIAKFINKI